MGGREFWKRILRAKLVNPEYAFIARAEMGLRYLLHEMKANFNFSEIERRVSGQSQSTG